MIKKHYAAFLFITHLLICPGLVQGQTVSETQHTLQQLDHKIAVIQKDLNQTHTQQIQLQRQLSITEQQIRDNENILRTIQQKIPLKQAEITQIEKKIAESQQEFTHLQTLLIRQIQARYKQEPNQPLEWLFAPLHKTEADQLLTYYQYVLHAHEDILQKLRTTQTTLQNQQSTLQHEIEALHHLRAQAQR